MLNVANRGTFDHRLQAAVIEVPCRIDASGPHALPVGRLDLPAQGLVTCQKAAERATIEAASTRSRALAVKALALHPLVGSVSVARRILDRQLAGVPELTRLVRARLTPILSPPVPPPLHCHECERGGDQRGPCQNRDGDRPPERRCVVFRRSTGVP